MCGIAGFATADEATEIASALAQGIYARGPDGTRWETHSGWCLVQTRLAIIDLSERVVYPMRNEQGTVALVFNGEIYNHRELRAQLTGRGHHFATNCDAEVIVHGWEEWGEDLFARLSGMFAIALVDGRSGELVLARDRLGIKPLVHTTGERLGFASDALALVAAGLSAGEVDRDAVAEYAAFHYVPHPYTGVADIRQLEPGTLLRRQADGETRFRRWAAQPFAGDGHVGPAPDAGELDSTLLRAVERHLTADVEVGILLSGGVDSRLVLSIATALGARPRAYTLSFAGHGDFDESRVARNTARFFGVPHREVGLDLDFPTVLEGIAGAYDQPFADASAIATIAVSRLAREEVKVVLTGTGGDDLFAGYSRHRAHLLARFFRGLPAPALEQLARLRGARGSERQTLLSLGRSYTARLAEAARGDVHDQYLSLAADHTSACGAALLGVEPALERQRVADRLGLRDPGLPSVLRELQAFELRSYLPGDLLTKEDRATMAVGLEGRVPLLDLEVLTLAERTDDRQRATLRSGKRLLREVASARLRDVPSSGRKRGFAVPIDTLMQGKWRQPAAAQLRDAHLSSFDGPVAGRLVEDGKLPATDAWALCVLAAWEERLGRCRRSKRLGETREAGARRQ